MDVTHGRGRLSKTIHACGKQGGTQMTTKTYSYTKHLHFEADVRDKRPNLKPAWTAQTCGGGGSQNPRKSITDKTHMHSGGGGNRRWDTIPLVYASDVPLANSIRNALGWFLHQYAPHGIPQHRAESSSDHILTPTRPRTHQIR